MAPGARFVALLLAVALVLSCGGNAERGERAATQIGSDRTPPSPPVHVDVGGIAGADGFVPSHVFVDPATGDSLVVGKDEALRPTMRRCRYNGRGCRAMPLDAERGRRTAIGRVAAAFDPSTRTLLIAADDAAQVEPAWRARPNPRLSLFRCHVDTGACAWGELAPPFVDGRLREPHMVFDPLRREVLVATCSVGSPGLAEVLRCSVDRTVCEAMPVRASGCVAAEYVDDASRAAVFVTEDRAVVRCDLDGTACSTTGVSWFGPQASITGATPDVDPGGLMLLVVQHDAPRSVKLVRCDLASRWCSARTIAEGARRSPRLLRNANELVIVVERAIDSIMVRCASDGTSCHDSAFDLGATDPDDVADDVAAVSDDVHDTTLIAAQTTLVRIARNGAAGRSNVSATRGMLTYFDSRLDQARGTLHVLSRMSSARIAGGSEPGTVLTTCRLDGTHCVVAPSGRAFLVLGSTGDDVHLLGNTATGDAAFVRCDGAGQCTSRVVLSADGSSLGTGVLDARRREVFVARSVAAAQTAQIFRCALDDGSCFLERAVRTPEVHSLVIADGALFIDAWDRILRCDDGAAECASIELKGVTATTYDGQGYAAAPIMHDGTLYIARALRSGDRARARIALFRCAHGRAPCNSNVLDLGDEERRIQQAAVAIDSSNGKLALALQDDARLRKPTLVLCGIDGSSCTEHDVSAGQPADSATHPTLFFDTDGQSWMVVTRNDANLGRPSLFRFAVP